VDEIWVVLEQEQGELDDVSWEIVGQGRELADRLNQRLCAVIMGSEISALGEVLNHRGVDEAYLLDSPNLGTYSPELYLQSLSKLIQECVPQVVLFSATPNGSDLSSRVAAKLRIGLVSDCVAFDLDEKGLLLQSKPTHKAKVCSTIVSPHVKPQLATIRPGTMEVKDLHSAKETKVTKMSPRLDTSKCSIRAAGFIKTDPLALPVEEADVIVAGGRGVGSGENFRLLEEVARAFEGTVGASRVAVDNRWVPRERQVGQSGKTVKPKLYIACGISGSSHHVLGMKDSEIIVAINTDPDAPIIKLADVAILGDLLEIVPAITSEIAQQREAREKK
jgi:electron transfer flavoprotein alpha subunit